MLSPMTESDAAYELARRPATMAAVEESFEQSGLGVTAMIFCRRHPYTGEEEAGVAMVHSGKAATCDTAMATFHQGASLLAAAGDAFAVHFASPSYLLPAAPARSVTKDVVSWLVDDAPTVNEGVLASELRERVRSAASMTMLFVVERDWRASDGSVERQSMTRGIVFDEGRLLWRADGWSQHEDARIGPTTILNRAARYLEALPLQDLRVKLAQVTAVISEIGAGRHRGQPTDPPPRS